MKAKGKKRKINWEWVILPVLVVATLGVAAYKGETDPNVRAYNKAQKAATHAQDMSDLAKSLWDTCSPVVSGDPNETPEQARKRYEEAGVNGQDRVSGSLQVGEIIRNDLTLEPVTPGTPVCDISTGAVSILDEESRVTEIMINLDAVYTGDRNRIEKSIGDDQRNNLE